MQEKSELKTTNPPSARRAWGSPLELLVSWILWSLGFLDRGSDALGGGPVGKPTRRPNCTLQSTTIAIHRVGLHHALRWFRRCRRALRCRSFRRRWSLSAYCLCFMRTFQLVPRCRCGQIDRCSAYSAHEFSTLSARRYSSAALPVDIQVETLVAVFLSCVGLVIGSQPLKPISWSTWAGKIEKEGAPNPFQALDNRVGFMDIRVSLSACV